MIQLTRECKLGNLEVSLASELITALYFWSNIHPMKIRKFPLSASLSEVLIWKRSTMPSTYLRHSLEIRVVFTSKQSIRLISGPIGYIAFVDLSSKWWRWSRWRFKMVAESVSSALWSPAFPKLYSNGRGFEGNFAIFTPFIGSIGGWGRMWSPALTIWRFAVAHPFLVWITAAISAQVELLLSKLLQEFPK